MGILGGLFRGCGEDGQRGGDAEPMASLLAAVERLRAGAGCDDCGEPTWELIIAGDHHGG